MGAKKITNENGTERRVIWGGGTRGFIFQCKMLDKFKIKYMIRTSGAVKWIYQGGDTTPVMRFVTKQGTDPRVGAACRRVLADVRKYEEKHDRIQSPHRGTYNKAVGTFSIYLMKGGREMVMIDVKACYWTICLQAGIISQETYDKYKNDKLLRLIPIGNLNKPENDVEIVGGRIIEGSEKIKYNYHSWVWHYVVFKAFELFEKVNEATNNRVFMFKTDCFYVAPADAQKVKDVITSEGFEFTEEKRTVLGYNRGRIVMRSQKKEIKVSNFGLPRSAHELLPFIEVEQKVYNEEEIADRAVQAIEKHVAKPLTPSKEFDEITTPKAKAKKPATPKAKKKTILKAPVKSKKAVKPKPKTKKK